MYNKIFAILCLIVLFFDAAAQSTWVRLNYPESEILGKVVKSYQPGEINFDGNGNHILNPTFDTSISADDLTEYDQQFSNFFTKYFSNTKFKVTEIKAKRLLIKRLNIKSIEKMSIGSKYVYSGLCADSVEVTIGIKKDRKYNYSKLIKDVAGLVTGQKASGTVMKIVPFLDSISSQTKDSIWYKMSVANPNVFYKVQIVTLEASTHDWENYWIYFDDKRRSDSQNNNFSETLPMAFRLEYAPLETRNSSKSRYPEFWGKDNDNVIFKLILKKDDGFLHLFVAYKGGILNDEWQYLEVPYKDVNLKRYWVMDRKFVYSFVFRGITKLVYIQVRAEQIGPDSINVINATDGEKQTFMQYPEVTFKYITTPFKN